MSDNVPWALFETTGDIEFYLTYKNGEEGADDADRDGGADNQGGGLR